MAKTIVHDEAGNAKWGDEDLPAGRQDHLQVAQSRSFASLIFELLSEQEPTEGELKVFELILNLSIDHGPDTPSAVSTIEAAKAGKSISESLAAGILEINDSHGGAQERLMEILYRIENGELKIENFVKQKLEMGERIAGYGHRIYKTEDPRAQLILNTLKENGFSEEFIKIAQDLEKELEAQKGNKLPLNIDGAIAVVLCSFGWPSKLGKAVFIIARTPGLCGQYLNSIDKK